MQKESDDSEEPRSRTSSRRNSGPFSRKGSIKKEPEKKTASPASCSSTPKKTIKTQNFDFTVTGKQILKRDDRTSSLPSSHNRRQSVDSLLKSKRSLDSPRKIKSKHSKSRDTSLEYDTSLDLTQISDFELNMKEKLTPLATSTPKSSTQKTLKNTKEKKVVALDSKDSVLSSSRDSAYKNSSSSGTYRHGISTELDYSSMSPECSGPSSGDSIAGVAPDTLISPRSQDLQDSSFCVSTGDRELGEWGHFWANYNNSLARVPMNRYYDQCPTPYRSDDIDLADLEFPSESSKLRSPDNIKTINNIIRNEGLRLTPRETQNIIKCAHILGNVLTKAVERQTKEREFSMEKIQELNDKSEKNMKKSMTLNLKETVLPVEVREERSWQSVPTQTDISLPNTKSAPIIFENILRQLSMSFEDVNVSKENETSNSDVGKT